MAYCSPAAQARGVCPGISLAEATALLDADAGGRLEQASPSPPRPRPAAGHLRAAPSASAVTASATWYVAAHDPWADLLALKNLASWCEKFSSLVGLDDADTPSGLLLDVGGSAARLGGEVKLAADVVRKFQDRGYVIRVAIADTVGTAWAWAHYGAADQPATEPAPIIVGPKQSLAALQVLPIEALRVAPETCELLHQLGVREIGQLLQLPRHSLLARFGDQLLRRLDQATGNLAEAIQADHAPPTWELSQPLEYPTARRATVELLLSQLIDELCRGLQLQDTGVIQLECRFALTSGSHFAMHLGLFRPTVTAAHLRELIRTQLEHRVLPSPVQNVTVRAALTAPLDHQQQRLLDDGPVGPPQQALTRLIDRLSSRLGPPAVVAPRLLSEPQIENSFHYVPLTGQRPAAVRSSPAAVARHQAASGQRPLQWEPAGVPLRVMALAPDGPPLSFCYRNRRHRILCHWGPERIETGWWRGPLIRRDYYRVEDQHGSRFWLFRDLETRKWFLQGSFV